MMEERGAPHLQPSPHPKQGGACDVFPERLYTPFMPEWRLWWPNLLAGGWVASERRGHQRLARFRTFQTTCDLKFFVKVKVFLSTLADV